MDFTYTNMKGWEKTYNEALRVRGPLKAFIGSRDSYRWTGTVSLRRWTKLHGAPVIYDGTHYMEERWVRSLLVPAIKKVAHPQLSCGCAKCKKN